ncbi:MAG: putative transport system permease protein [Gaiellaceae bacterium]|nr:putative transport system permease protein [Gaiellaceae bacterium]
MWRFVGSQFRYRRSRTAALALAILVASVSFTLLTASAKSSSLRVHGTLTSSFRPAYDILVRPPQTQTALERSQRLVRPNFLSGVYGGITVRDWQQILHMQGVAVAAPVANVGYVLPRANVPISLTGLVDKAPYQLYRIRTSWVANGGVSRYPSRDLYVYYTPGHVFTATRGSAFVESGARAKPLQSCGGFRVGLPSQPESPFPPLASQSFLACFPAAFEALGFGSPFSVNGFPSTEFPRDRSYVGTAISAYFPIYITAIDPAQEAKLVGLDKAVVRGRYLGGDEGLMSYTPVKGGIKGNLIPILASTRTYIDERLDLRVERLQLPQATNVPRMLATGTCAGAANDCQTKLAAPAGSAAQTARDFVTGLPGRTVSKISIPASAIYQQLLREPSGAWRAGILSPDAYWTTSQTRYRTLGPEHLTPVAVSNPESVWASKFSNFYTPPRDNLDPQYRKLHERVSSNLIVHNTATWNPLQVVGEFDPTKLASFSALSKVPLETYAPPTLTPAREQDKKALQGGQLLPNQNLGSYIQQPPLLLTTMQGLKSFLNPQIWQTASGASAVPAAQRAAPISAIRIKVAGVTGPDALSLERIRVVAQRIHDATGLVVDITAGSSPHPVLISLPKGRFGQPALQVYEGWSKKGVTVGFLQALDRKDLGLFALILVICGFFLGNGTLASVRARRSEIGTLLTIGWSRPSIFRVVLAELAVAGLAAGIVGAAIAALLTKTLALDAPLTRSLLVIPVALGLALVFGVLPAWSAARGAPRDALVAPVTNRRRGRPVRHLLTLALANVTRLPMRTALGAAGLALGVSALTVLFAIQHAFQGTLVGTVLGNAVSVQVHGADFFAAGLTVALAELSVADVVYLNLRERAAEIVTLKTIGWAWRHIAFTVLLEGLLLGLLGSLAGAVIGLLVGSLVFSLPLGSLALAAAISACGGVAAAMLACLLPLSQLARLTAPTILAAE